MSPFSQVPLIVIEALLLVIVGVAGVVIFKCVPTLAVVCSKTRGTQPEDASVPIAAMMVGKSTCLSCLSGERAIKMNPSLLVSAGVKKL